MVVAVPRPEILQGHALRFESPDLLGKAKFSLYIVRAEDLFERLLPIPDGGGGAPCRMGYRFLTLLDRVTPAVTPVKPFER